jgi:N-acetylglucosamine-6-phosphate deacetylase
VQLLVKNGLILQSNGLFLKGHIGVEKGKIAALWYGEIPPLCETEGELDAEGFMVCPGLIDTHNHGGNGFGYTGDETEWEKIQDRLSRAGVTAILPTLESSTFDETLGFIGRIQALMKKNNSNRVDILGIHLEGPYLNKDKKGMHQEQFIRPASGEEIGLILEKAGGIIRVWSLAPEIRENMDVIKTLAAAGVSVSVAHTEAGYNTALDAFAAGATRVTHMFNAMTALHRRYQGILTAAWQHGAFMELIADGHHVSPTIIKMFAAASDPGRIVLVTDNNECSGLPEGSYTIHGRPLIIEGGKLICESGILAGSVAGLNQCAFTVMSCGFSPGTALKMASENPALAVGVFDRKGSIAVGKDADFAVLNGQFEAAATVKAGRIVYPDKAE